MTKKQFLNLKYKGESPKIYATEIMWEKFITLNYMIGPTVGKI